MANARISWTLPQVSPRQRPIAHVRIEARVVASPELPWTAVNEVAPPETSLPLEQIAPGEWEFRGIVVDEAGAESEPKFAALSVPFDPPGALVELSVTLE